MSDRDVLEEARELLAGITPGPWRWTGEMRQRLVTGDGPESLDREIIRCAALLHPGAADAEFIAASPDLMSRLVDALAESRAEVELLRADLDSAAYISGRRQSRLSYVTAGRDEALAATARVREIAEGWLTEPCVGGYRIPNGNDDDSQCLHCGADVLLEAMDGGEQS